MSIKTVLVHLASDSFWEQRLHQAIELCKPMQAHLIVLGMTSPIRMPAGAEGRGASVAFLRMTTNEQKELADTFLEKTKALTKDSGVSWVFKTSSRDHLEEIAMYVHHTDLTIIGELHVNALEDRLMFKPRETLIIEAGGPVLIMPNNSSVLSFEPTRHVMVAWDNSKQAIRAVRESLAILQSAGKVSVLAIDNNKSEPNPIDTIIDYLKRHNIDAIPIVKEHVHHKGKEILAQAQEIDAEFLVMGAYRNLSLTEKIFGSTTRYIFNHTHIPLIVSH